jgi:hypothetical protein
LAVKLFQRFQVLRVSKLKLSNKKSEHFDACKVAVKLSLEMRLEQVNLGITNGFAPARKGHKLLLS